MKFNLLFFASWFWAFDTFAFVHINQVKPHLPVTPEKPTITFQWNGDSPTLSDKAEVLDGFYKDVSDAELFEVLLRTAMSRWTSVESAYLVFAMEINPGVVIDSEDEIYAIVVEDQDSKSVAAAALPSFVSENKGDSPNKQSGRIIFDCDISVSSAKVSAKSLLNTLVHELGHCVGLGHPHSNYHSIMSYSNMGEHGELGLDDKAGISFLYPEPSDSQKVKYMTTCDSLGGVAENVGANLFLLLSPLVLLFVRRGKFS